MKLQIKQETFPNMSKRDRFIAENVEGPIENFESVAVSLGITINDIELVDEPFEP
jgi:hypothetical protein